MNLEKEFIHLVSQEKRRNPSKFSVEGVNFEINTDSQESTQYINRVIYPFQNLLALGDQVNVNISTHTRNLEDLDEYLNEQTILAKSPDGLWFGHTQTGVFFMASTSFNYINFSWEKDTITYHACISEHPEFSAMSLIKMHILQESSRRLDPLLVFHASSVVHLDSGSGLVFSTADNGRENLRKFGKTATVLACIGNKLGKYAFGSNDELLLGLKDDRLNLIVMPNEIPIREDFLRSAFLNSSNVPKLEEWVDVDQNTGLRTHITTTAGLADVNVSVEKPKFIKDWFFVDLDLGMENNQLCRLSKNVAQTLFTQSVFDRRMKQTITDICIAEQDHLLDIDVPNINPEIIYDKLWQEGVRFWQLSGSADLASICQAVSQIDN